MSSQNRFALVGKSGSGKSEVGLMLSEHLGLRIIKTGAICREIAKLLFGNDDKRSTQLLDDALTNIDPSIFLRAALRDVVADEGFVIDALRFEQDLVIARELGCVVIRVRADDATRVRRLQARGQSFVLDVDGRHRSEVELDAVPVDYEIVNQGQLSELRARLTSLLE